MEIIKEKTVSFTGHRTLTTPGNAPDTNLENVIKTELYCLIRDYYEDGYTNYLNGMAIGFDMLAAEVVLEFKKLQPDVKLFAVIPFQGQELCYSQKDKLRYKYLYDNADERIFTSSIFTSNADYLKRNDYLVSNSSVLISYCDGKQRSGTTSTVNKASKAGLEVINLYEEMSDYFSNQSDMKRLFQRYSYLTSMQFGREGIIIRGADDNPLDIGFEQIESVKDKRGCVFITLKNGIVVRASLISDDCRIKFPDDELSLWEAISGKIHEAYEKMFGRK